ncbi:MAG: zinc metallopeptidase [Firmicutes bacterium]|jgi:Zn-dependent membrane protease YugP|nr:zinc metallopeptidase [Bacillota bacterium]
MPYNVSVIFLFAAIIITMIAQAKVNSNFRKYSKVRNNKGITGAEAARTVLDANGLNDVRIEKINGNLTDHYDPRKRVLRLSQSVYGVNSVAAVSVACHEAGHAIQHATSYAPLKIRNSIVPIVNIASSLSWILIIVGIGLLYTNYYMGDLLFNIGVIAFVTVIAFHAITLPVEFDASRRALKQMEIQNIIDEEEDRGAKKVLGAAAMTYVASLTVAIANLLRILALRGRD